MGARVLVVDDDESIRQIVTIFLRDEGYDVLAVAHGQAAAEVVGTFAPDLILLDLRMPIMDGWEFARWYRSQPPPHAPIIAFVAALNVVQDTADLNAAGILTKPFDLEELLAAVSSGLGIPT